MNLSDFNWPLFIPSAITLIAGVLSIIFASKSKTVRQVGVLLVGVGIVLCVAGLFVPNNDPNQTTAEPPASTPMDIPTSSVAAATPTTPTTPTTAATDANAASAGTDPYLAELKVLQDALDVYYNKTYEVSGQPYVHSILADCGSNCTTQKKISYNLGKKYRKLTFGVGIEDNSATREQVAVFTLIADGKPIFEKTTQKNEPVTSQLVWMTPQLHS
jgi:hypothetical protein